MTGVSHLGPWPGTDVLQAMTTMIGELGTVPDGVVGLPTAVQMPERGPIATSVGRTSAMLTDMPVEIGPHGWKLADRAGADIQRARTLLAEDIDALAVAGHGWEGPLVVPVRGPWTLAAELYLARGDRVLSDLGAVRELVAAMADGFGELLRSVTAAVPGARPWVVLREQMLPDVMGGTVSTFSGHGRIPAAAAEPVTEALRQVVEGARAAGAEHVVCHGGNRFASRSFAALTASGADAVGLSAAGVRGAQWEQVAAAVEAGQRMWFGLPRQGVGRRLDVRGVADLVVGPWRATGLPVAGLADVVVHVETSGSGLGSDVLLGDKAGLRSALRNAVQVALDLAERATA